MRITEFCKRTVNSARNIFILIYAIHIGYLSGCRTEFDNIETRALLSQIVVVARIINLDPAPPDSTRDYSFNIATIMVTSVLKAPNSTDYSISRRSSLRIDGFLPHTNTFNLSQPTLTVSRNGLNQLGSQTLTERAERHCLSIVQENSEYILFINHTTDRLINLYYNAQPAQLYTKSDKDRIKNVLCENCATEPNAKAKRKIRVTQGASNYKLTCRVTGNPEPDIRWYKNDEELTSETRGIHIKPVRKRRKTYSISIRIKHVSPEHAGTYKCVARNIKGSDSAKTTLTVLDGSSVSTGSQQQTTDSVRTVPKDEVTEVDLGKIEDRIEERSHYVACTGRDKYFCLNGGQCRVHPDGRYKHCRCLARFTGTRCEETDISYIPKSTKPLPSTRPITATDPPMELKMIIIILASALAAVILMLCLLCFCVAGWFYGRLDKFKRNQISRGKNFHVKNADEVDCIKNWSRPAKNNNLTTSTGMQTEPYQRDPVRNSLDLVNHFPRTSSDVSLRHQPNSRPSSQSDWRPRSRLSGLSSLNPAARPPALSPPEEEPSTVTSPVQECLEEMERFLASHAPDSVIDNHNNNYTPKAYCDPSAANTSEPVSLHISEPHLELSNSTLSDTALNPKSNYYDLYNGYLLGKQNNTEQQFGS